MDLLNISFLTDNSYLLLLVIAVLTFLIFLSRKNKKELPGPFGFPFIGHLSLLKNNPGSTLVKLSEKYGDVFKIKLGTKSFIILNGYTANRETLNDLSAAFSGRPDTYMFKSLFKEGIDFTGPWNEDFKLSRKASVKALGIAASVRATYFKQRINEATANFFTELKCNYQDKFINPEKHLIQMSGHVTCGILFGKLSPDCYDEQIYDMFFQLNRFEKEFYEAELLDCYPFLELLFGWYNFNFKLQARKFKQFLIHQIEKHQNSTIENVPNVLDSLLEFHKEQPGGLSVSKVAGHMIFLIEGGVETVPSALLWFFLLFGERPELQEKLYKHIEEKVGNQQIQFEDNSKLPFLEACLLELHRFASIGPLGFNHGITEDVTYKGYHIPKGTGVISNIWSVHHEKNIWTNPDQFDPDRFMKPGGEEVDSHLAGKIMPFGIGRRRCVGENLTKLHMFIFCGSVVQRFKFETDSSSSASLKTLEMMGVARPNPFKIKVTPR